ncbi:putative protein N(5)-glutamine methyltransferase [Paenibacillus sp. GCM10023248]|uniref:putative protein N(5)-glutamine methyltransferase n=1 Tax=Bacillales TaxID=1385 RepID=UPI002379DACE|nr:MULTISPECIES: putative protein N(5)-glutamine methyltransferase [Bacillales]MDD9269024.1 putative protein N(5)-glutamine methyltransferase [Paenibacillus sp. MAHUQ-63]
MFARVTAKLRAAGCVYAEEECRLLMAAARDADELDDMANRRAAGLPIEHIIGWVEFGGRRIAVDPHVFVPRYRTEFLLRQTIGCAKPGDVVLDLCCGTAALGVALAAAMERIELHCVDIDPAAVRCARRNAAAVCGQVYEGDLFAPLPAALRGRIDVVVANAPYVPTDAIRRLPAEAREHEARTALDGGVDGLDIQRRIAAEALRWLAPGGYLLVETSEQQAPYTAGIFADNGLTPQVVSSEDMDATVVIGTRAIL